MPVQAFPYLAITDGSTNVVILNGLGTATSYPLTRGTWAPTIAALRRGTLGGRGPYGNVVEELDISVTGVDAVTAMTNLEALVRLLDQAERFGRLGQNVAPVVLQYAPQGSTLFTTANPAQCLILGRASEDDISGVQLPEQFTDVGMVSWIDHVRVRFVRAGLWLNAIAETTSSAAAANPSIRSVTLTTALTISAPTLIKNTWSASPLTAAPIQSLMLYAGATNRLQIYEAEAGALYANVTSVIDTTNKARGSNVARYTPVNTNQNGMVDITFVSLDTTTRRLAIYAAVRNNSATTTWQLQLRSAGAEVVTAPPVLIDASTTNPRIVFLGALSYGAQPTVLTILAQASAASGTLDIDYVTVLCVDDDRSGAIALTWPDDTTVDFQVDPRPLSAVTPRASTTNNRVISYAGDAMIHTSGQVVAMTIMQTSNAFWRVTDSIGTVLNMTLAASRYNAYLTPR